MINLTDIEYTNMSLTKKKRDAQVEETIPNRRPTQTINLTNKSPRQKQGQSLVTAMHHIRVTNKLRVRVSIVRSARASPFFSFPLVALLLLHVCLDTNRIVPTKLRVSLFHARKEEAPFSPARPLITFSRR